jgi:glycosyltransferase involved in cell wall biosynthesis
VVSKGNAVSDIIDRGKFGFSVNYGDINELARIMGKMLGNGVLLREMGQNGRKFIFEKFGWPNIVAKLEKVYEEINGLKKETRNAP